MQPDKKKQCFVILGVQRSGTSLLSRLVNNCGISFGNQKKFKKADGRNPNGFYEYVDMVKLDEKLLKQSGFSSPFVFDNTTDFRSIGLLNSLKRGLSRLKMVIVLHSISTSGDNYAFKEFPLSFYFWKQYVPKAKIIAIYRDPFSNANSLVRSFKMHTYRQSIEHWTAMNKELLYHISVNKSILINLDDLVDKEKQEKILNKLVSFVGGGDVGKLKKLIETLNSNTDEHVKKLKYSYPVNEETIKVLDSLEKAKIS